MVRKSIGLGVVFSATPTTASTAFVTMGGVRDATGPGAVGDDVDTSTLDNATLYKTFQRGQVDPGEVTFTLAHSSTDPSQQQLVTALNDGVRRNLRFTPPSTASESSEDLVGYVKSMGREGMAADAMITRTLTFKVSGSPGFTST